MPYQVLARKYRPQRFSDVIGQDHVTRTLLNALSQDRIAHGYIFSGHRGIGKTTIARILAMALQCRTQRGTAERPTPEPCGNCEACVEIRAGNAIDVIEIDAATNRGIDEIRELREGARYSPARDKYKIYILDEAHQITDAAFNALLKILEEPPAHVVFMMATTQPEDIPQTIRSRCQHFSFHAVPFQQIVGQLRDIADREDVLADDAALSLLAEAGDGSMRDALSIMDQAVASAPVRDNKHVLDAALVRSLMGTVSNQIFEKMMDAVREHDAAAMLTDASQLLDAGNGPQPIARQMVRFLRNCLMCRVAGKTSELLQISDEERARAQHVAEQFSEEDLTRFLNSMLRTFDDLGYRQEQRFHLELGLLKLVHMQRLLPFEDLLRQFSGGTGSVGSASVGPGPGGAGSGHRSTPAAPASATAKGMQGASTIASTDATAKAQSVAKADKPTVENTRQPLDGIFHSTVKQLPEELAAAPNPSSPAKTPTSDSTPETSQDPVDGETLRCRICEALTQGGHETVGSLFADADWNWDGNELRIRVAASKTMLGMAYNPEAQKIVRDVYRTIGGSNRAVQVEPGGSVSPANGPSKNRQPAQIPETKNDLRPQDHPLIRHAQQLFHAEIRSVVSLRDQR